MAQLTELSSGNTPLGRWTNWSLNPVFPVLANELVNYLSATRPHDEVHGIGESLMVSVPEAGYEPTFRFLLPTDGPTKAELPIEATPADGLLTATLPDVAASGIYELQLQPKDGNPERRAYAFNVPVGEGDLQIVPRSDITQQLAGVNYQFHDASEMTLDEQQLAGLQMSDALLVVLIVLLLVEQLLAYFFSYHIQPSRGQQR